MEWRVCRAFPDYAVSEFGDVRRIVDSASRSKAGKVLKHRISNGYAKIELARDGRPFKTSIHRLVTFAFHGDPPFPGAEVCHNDGDKTNNHYSNLRWDSPRNNQIDRIYHGKGGNKLSPSDIPLIRGMLDRGMRSIEIADTFGVKRRTIDGVAYRATWSFIQ